LSERLSGGVVDSKIEKEAAAARDDETGYKGEALEVEGRDGVEGADG
jgi:hypothetical protein